jgi:two-component system, NarL family, nitrate/nitrite response regulator NarL
MLGAVKVAIIDDHPLYRAGIRQAIDAAGDLEVVAEGADAVDAMHIAASREANLILLDLNIPGGGIELACAIGKAHPEAKIVFLTNSESEVAMSAAMQVGAFGYVVKGIGGEELVSILRQVSRGEAYVTPSLAAGALRNARNARALHHNGGKSD